MRKYILIYFYVGLWLGAAGQRDSTKTADNNCDVITLKNGELIYCKINAIKNGSIVYNNCGDQSKTLTRISTDSVTMINYPDGSRKMFSSKSDIAAYSNDGKIQYPFLYFSMAMGISIPISSYASHQNRYHPTSENTDPAGYASPGAAYCLSTDIFYKTIGIRLTGGYSSNQLDAQSFLDDSYHGGALSSFLSQNYWTKKSTINSVGLTSTGSYYYTGFFFMGNIEKSISSKISVLSFCLGWGIKSIQTPAMSGTIQVNSTDSLNKNSTTNYSWQVNFARKTDVSFLDIGINYKIKLITHLYVTVDLDCELSYTYLDIGFPSKILDSNNNAIVSPGLGISSGASTFSVNLGITYGL